MNDTSIAFLKKRHETGTTRIMGLVSRHDFKFPGALILERGVAQDTMKQPISTVANKGFVCLIENEHQLLF